ncbi:MAG: Argininosuccinate lyase [Hydrogenibacillus schlegelii]|uniref:Argininosuccinate lyase n=1 Tax=Hydrogenibacillus schlegelii TaxID=1484 RepID=A0A2T5G9R6_HYDSH|nr:argininosuccinate lyase [Hydrogenibacillus schlegelii]PTQ52920.1 MAG: Argininosuccinate lyase [Hydrogenibacillus schlegelii]
MQAERPKTGDRFEDASAGAGAVPPAGAAPDRADAPNARLWGGRFEAETDPRVHALNASIPFDRRLVREDLEGSLAHATMLGETGIIAPEDAEAIIAGLKALLADAEAGRLSFRLEDEDIHMNLERLLLERIGPVGGKLHTARSRNDQVALDLHLFVRRQAEAVVEKIRTLQRALLHQAEAHVETILPGYTHLKRAQPVSLAHHLLAYVWMLERDVRRFRAAQTAADVSPLGAGALAGTTHPIDPHRTAALLGLAGIYPNSIDAVSDRDFALDFLYAASMLMMHLSRLGEEIVLWASDEFGFVELPDAFATGSSIMPQKKNPDVFELTRAKSGRVFGHLFALLTVLKGLPLAYNKDLQEDKEGLFDTVDTVHRVLDVLAPAVETLRFRSEAMLRAVRESYANATELADYLVRKGVPFRDAHAAAGRLVRLAADRGVPLEGLPLEDFKAVSPLIGPDVYTVLDPVEAVRRRTSPGGTGFDEVRRQLAQARQAVDGPAPGAFPAGAPVTDGR